MEKKIPVDMIDLNGVHDCTNPHNCGYCDNPTGSVTWGLSSNKLSSACYEQIMNKGWRRCGTYYYKPNLQKACCKSYTIRMDIDKFKIKKQQKKTVKHMIDLVKVKKSKEDGKKGKNKEVEKPKQKEPEKIIAEKIKVKTEVAVSPEVANTLMNVLWVVNEKLAAEKETFLKLIKLKEGAAFTFDVKPGIKIFGSRPGSKGDYYSNYVMLLYGKNKASIHQTSMHDFGQQVQAYIVERLRQISFEYSYNIEYSGYLIFTKNKQAKTEKQGTEDFEVVPQVILIEPPLKKKEASEEFQLVESPQKGTQEMKVIQQQDPAWPPFIITDSKISFGRLQIQVVPVQQSPQSFALYSKYSKNIHNKQQKSMSSYTGFLCEDALKREQIKKQIQLPITYNCTWDEKGQHLKPIVIAGTVTKRLGCYHMKYSYDGRLIGVGVVDFLPCGLSSVYYFYDHTFKEYRLGVFSSLVEIQYLRYLNKAFPEFKYYYMGYYIQNCKKMNYKADYEPCELLCPATLTYVPVDKQLRQTIDNIIAKKIQSARLSNPTTPMNPDLVFPGDVGVYVDKNLKIYYRGNKITLKDLDKRFFLPILMILKSHVQAIGKKAFEMLSYEV